MRRHLEEQAVNGNITKLKMILGCNVKSPEGVDRIGPNRTPLVTKTGDKLQSKQSHTRSHQPSDASRLRV